MPQTRTTVIAKNSLEKQLYTVQELFERFAVPLDLPDIKLALCFCSSTYDEDAIEDFYTEIIDRGYYFDSSKICEEESVKSALHAIIFDLLLKFWSVVE